MKRKNYTKEDTVKLAQSLRGQFVIGKALYVAVKTMEKESRPAISDIEQMKEIGENLFPIGYLGAKASEKFSEKDILQELEKKVKKCEEQ
tara:strand:+ start:83 stop:352 length:270 start_codon:yes stop_codon:yes gene_type:complete